MHSDLVGAPIFAAFPYSDAYNLTLTEREKVVLSICGNCLYTTVLRTSAIPTRNKICLSE